jgi:hypothetical protein
MNFDNLNKLFLKTISNKVMSNFNMFSFSVLHRIFNNAYVLGIKLTVQTASVEVPTAGQLH